MRSMDFLWNNLQKEGEFYHTYKMGKPGIQPFRGLCLPDSSANFFAGDYIR
jgi:hypothetical protein